MEAVEDLASGVQHVVAVEAEVTFEVWNFEEAADDWAEVRVAVAPEPGFLVRVVVKRKLVASKHVGHPYTVAVVASGLVAEDTDTEEDAEPSFRLAGVDYRLEE